MQILEFVTWEETVLPTWNSNHPNMDAPNEFIWTQFPNDIVWHSAIIEADDIEQLCTIGSLDWFEVFRTLRLRKLCQNFGSALQSKDKYKHIDRILALQSFYATGQTLAPLILIAPDRQGPYVLVDGNHRASALLLNEMLIGQAVLIGTSKNIPSHVAFYQHSVTM